MQYRYSIRPCTVAALIASAFIASAAQADTVVVPSSHVGWYSFYGQHIAGYPSTLTGVTGGGPFRSFYIWQVPPLSGTITSARIDFRLDTTLGASGTTNQIGRIYDMKARVKTLPYIISFDGGGYGKLIYKDLGQGNVYGELTVPPANTQADPVWISAGLSDVAVRTLNASRGRPFGVGITNVTPGITDGTVFELSTFERPAQQNLVLEVTTPQ